MTAQLINANGTYLTETELYGEIGAYAIGTFDGATVTYRRKNQLGVYADIPNGAFTENTEKLFRYPAQRKNKFEVVVSGAGGSTSITIELG